VTRRARALQLSALALTASLAAAAPTVAQDTTVTVRDTLLQDTTIAEPEVELATAEPAVVPGPLPPGTRFTFTRDSLHWMVGQTLADLLGRIPGVYVARAGFLGRPEFVQYAGRGAAAVEIYWDGVPMVPLGSDSVGHDLGSVKLTYLERVDVQVLPAALRIHLVSERYGSISPMSKLRVMAGDYDTGAYAGLFQKRWLSGLGIDLAADFQGTEVLGRSSQTFDVWANATWYPSPRVGASYQVRRQNHDRSATTGVMQRNGARTDNLFTLFAGSRDDGLGLRAEGALASSSWSSDTAQTDALDQVVRQAQLRLRYMRPTWTAEVTGRVADARVHSAVEARLGWVPFRGLVLAGDAIIRRHASDVTSKAAHGSLGLYAGPFSLVADVAAADMVRAAALPSDSTHRTLDRSIRGGIQTLPLSGHVTIARRDAFLPLPYVELETVAAFDSTPAATYLIAEVSLRTSRALSFEAWYSNPIQGTPGDMQPVKHGRGQITFRSKFWRTFRSGAFDFKVQLAMESWSRGTAGLTADGSPIEFPGATVYDVFIQVALVDFSLFWHYRDARRPRDPYIPGLDYPDFVQTFGVKWTFLN